jgi:hypothetical protein
MESLLKIFHAWSSPPIVTRLGTENDIWWAFCMAVRNHTKIRSSRWDWQRAIAKSHPRGEGEEGK